MQEFLLLSRAKLNLSLQILGLSDNGFHEVKTFLVPLSLADELRVEVSDSWKFSCNQISLPEGMNLVESAARLFEKKRGKSLNYRVSLKKNIPIAAGLGGGSSNAASILLALNHLEGKWFSDEDLELMAQELGADVAFFLNNQAGWYGGRGDFLLEKIDISEKRKILLIKPSFGILASEAYRLFQADGKKEITCEFAGVRLQNDLEAGVLSKYLFLQVLKDWLLMQKGVLAVLLAGSGSTLAVFLKDEMEEIDSLLAEARSKFDKDLWGDIVHIFSNEK